ncbi:MULTISPECIES: hypothetical protein [Pseudomonas]|jgi:hypothetical protein|nr:MULTISPECIES: hypothetical protein [unclassified Pseudomonas]MBU0901072.1 hypothetical protein [Gammaproteobacteria bacterium]MDD2159116.1 hypothetical protein [Pseudomonas sp. MIL19]
MSISRPIKLAGLTMFLIVMIWVMAYPIARYLIPSDTFNEPFEPVYNGLNVLFTALAFGGVIITLAFQAEESRIARREEIERSIFELFQTFTSLEFQQVKDGAFRALLTGIQHREYAEYLASRLFVVEQLTFPPACAKTLRTLDAEKQSLDDQQIIHADRADRLMLDNILNFFAMLAQRESSATVIKHCDFAYDWWRPALWIIAELQQRRHANSEKIRMYCKNQLVTATLKALDKVYGHAPLNSSREVWEYITQHPKLLDFGLDPEFKDYLSTPETSA